MRKVRLSCTGSVPGHPSLRSSALLFAGILASGMSLLAQSDPSVLPANNDSGVLTAAESSSNRAYVSVPANPAPSLPEAPSPQIAPLRPASPPPPGAPPVAPRGSKYIPAGWRAQPLDVHGKIVVGAEDLYSFSNFAAMFLSAGYEQVVNSEPNYGTDKGAFGERLGAAAIRETSQGIFTDMVFAPLLREDPRYYELGPTHGVVHRTLYAITRPLVTRKDDGGKTVNGSLLLGYAASAALTPAVYPQTNRNFHDTLSTYGGSIGGAALGFFVGEFSDDVLQALHLRHNR